MFSWKRVGPRLKPSQTQADFESTKNVEIAKIMNLEEVHHLHLGVQGPNQCLYALKTH